MVHRAVQSLAGEFHDLEASLVAEASLPASVEMAVVPVPFDRFRLQPVASRVPGEVVGGVPLLALAERAKEKATSSILP